MRFLLILLISLSITAIFQRQAEAGCTTYSTIVAPTKCSETNP